MDNDKTKNISIGVLTAGIVILLLLLGYTYRLLHKSSDPVIITDTVTVTEYKDTIIYKTKHDTVLERKIIYKNDTLSLIDTLTVHDTVSIPIDHKVAEFNLDNDSLHINEKIYYQGYMAKIDSTEINYKFTYIPKKEKKYKIGQSVVIGLQGGYGLGIQPGSTVKFEPYIGIGVTYGFGITF